MMGRPTQGGKPERSKPNWAALRRDLSNVEDVRGHKLFAEMHHSFMRPLEERLVQAQAKGEIQPGDARFYARLLHGMIIALTFEGKPDKPRKVPAQEVEAAVDVFLNGVVASDD